MTPQMELLELIASEAEKNCGLSDRISLKELSAQDSIRSRAVNTATD